MGFAAAAGWVLRRCLRRAGYEGPGHWLLFVGLPIVIAGVVYLADLRQPMMQYLLVITTLWLTMSDAVLALVAHRGVWERERRLGLRAASLLAGNAAYLGLTAAGRVLLILVTVVVLHRVQPQPVRAFSVLHGDGWPWINAAYVGGVLYLVALAGTAMGLAISACCGGVLRAQQWLACLLLAQILLTVQFAADPDPQHVVALEGPARVVHLAAHAAAAFWGHDLLKLADPPPGWGHIFVAVLWLASLIAAAITIAWVGLRVGRDAA